MGRRPTLTPNGEPYKRIRLVEPVDPSAPKKRKQMVRRRLTREELAEQKAKYIASCKSKKKPIKLGVNLSLAYTDIPEKEVIDGWVDAEVWIPKALDLVYLKRNITDPAKPGWWSGTNWDGLRINSDSEYKFWKKAKDI